MISSERVSDSGLASHSSRISSLPLICSFDLESSSHRDGSEGVLLHRWRCDDFLLRSPWVFLRVPVLISSLVPECFWRSYVLLRRILPLVCGHLYHPLVTHPARSLLLPQMQHSALLSHSFLAASLENSWRVVISTFHGIFPQRWHLNHCPGFAAFFGLDFYVVMKRLSYWISLESAWFSVSLPLPCFCCYSCCHRVHEVPRGISFREVTDSISIPCCLYVALFTIWCNLNVIYYLSLFCL